MEEVGIDISDQYPKGVRTYMGKLVLNTFREIRDEIEHRILDWGGASRGRTGEARGGE
jgi:hypothetical protein